MERCGFAPQGTGRIGWVTAGHRFDPRRKVIAMRTFLKLAIVLLALQVIPAGFAAAQDDVPATPVPDVDICANFAEAATPEAGDQAEPADATFDLAYVDMMITSHQNTIIMLLIAENRAEHPELTEFVRESLEARRTAIETLLIWRSDHFPGAAWVHADQAMAIFDERAGANPGRGGVAGAREIADLPHIEELCATGDQPFDLTLIDHLLPQISGELLLSDVAQSLTEDTTLSATARDLAESFQREMDALYAWRTLWYPDADPAHAH